MSIHKQVMVESPAGRRLMAYLTIMNTRNTERLKVYVADNYADEALEKESVDARMRWHDEAFDLTGRLRIHQVVAYDEHYVVVMLQAERDDGYYISEFKVDEDYPHKIMKFNLHPAGDE